MRLYDWQREDVDRLAEAGYVGLLSIEPGGGKTVIATAAAVESGARQVLVIAPQGTHVSAWGPTVEKFGAGPVRVIGRNTKAQRDALEDFEFGTDGWFICTPQFFTRADISEWFPNFLIVDEVHQLGNPGSKGQRKLSGYSEKDMPIHEQVPMRLALSGTPARNKFERMWSVTKFLWPEQYGPAQLGDPKFVRWAKFHMTSRYTPFGKSKVAWIEEREPGRLFKSMPCVIQHFRRRECCSYHPTGFLKQEEPQVIPVSYELTRAQRDAVRDLQEQQLAWFDGHPMVTDIPITTQLRLRQVLLAEPTLTPTEDGEGYTVSYAPDAPSPLLDEMIDRLDGLDEDEPIVVFTGFQQFAELAVARFRAAGYSAFEFSGATRKTRDAHKELFLRGEIQVMVVVIQAGGTGMDGLQAVAKTEFWADRSLDRSDNEQGQARLDRTGAVGQVQRYIFQDSESLSDKRLRKEDMQNQKLARSMTVV